jgi:hypothetical protein
MFLECPQRWLNYYIKRLEPAYFNLQDEAMNAGTYGHKLLDIFYRLKFRGVGLNDALEACFAYNPDEDICECGCSKEFHCLVQVLNIEECKRCKKCTKYRAHPFNLSNLVRSQVRKRFREYVFNYQQNDIIPLSEQHVEVGFSESIFEDSENLFVLEGRIDIIGKLQGLECFMDHKFQTKTHWLYPRSIQFKNYSLITKLSMGVTNYVRLQQKIQPDSLTRDIITFNSVELAAWHKRLIAIFQRMKKVLQASQNKQEIERNWGACSGARLTYEKDKPQYCYYTTLCEEIDPRVAEGKEKQLFKIKENVWRPW